MRHTAFLCSAGLILALAFGPLVGSAIGDAHGGGHSEKFAKLGMQFEGAASCTGAQCHDSGGADRAPPKPEDNGQAANFNENLIWAKRDRHAKAYKSLTDEKGLAIAKAMNISSTSADCLKCHSTFIPEAQLSQLKGANFKFEEGNSCNSCHGPSGKWNPLHKDVGWTQNQRKANYKDPAHPTHEEHDKLLAAHGIFDTRPILMRAELCTSCHLAIPAEMVDAGHPQPQFELDFFTEGVPSKGKDYAKSAWKHWRTDKGGLDVARVWMAGQVVSARDAMRQLAARAGNGATKPERLNEAYQQAIAHGTMLAMAAKATGKGDFQAALDAVKAKKGDAAGLAAAATAAAEAAEKMFPAIDTMTFDEATAKKLRGEIAAMTGFAAEAGPAGQLQQWRAVYALGRATGDAKATEAAFKGMVYDRDKPMEPPAFEKALAEAAGKLK